MMKSQTRAALLLMGVASLIFLSGCGDRRPRTYAVRGSVTYQDQAVAGAQVMFSPEGGPPATGMTDESGEYRLRTFAEGDGAVPGRHRVTITKNVALPAEPDNPYPETRNELPARYAQSNQSGLIAEVTAGGQNEFHFKLTD